MRAAWVGEPVVEWLFTPAGKLPGFEGCRNQRPRAEEVFKFRPGETPALQEWVAPPPLQDPALIIKLAYIGLTVVRLQGLSGPLRVHSMYKNVMNLRDLAFWAVRVSCTLRTVGCGRGYEEYQDRHL